MRIGVPLPSLPENVLTFGMKVAGVFLPCLIALGIVYHVVRQFGLPEFLAMPAGWLMAGAALTTAINIFFETDTDNIPDYSADSTFVRGVRYITYEEAKRQAAKFFRKRPDRMHLYFGGVFLPYELAAYQNFILCGSAGSGKTTLFQLLWNSIFGMIGLPGKDMRALLYDPKQEVLPLLAAMRLQCEIILFHPLDKRGVRHDLAKDVLSPVMAFEIAAILIPIVLGDSNPWFRDGARSLLAGVIIALLVSKPGEWTLLEVLETLRDETRLRALLATTEDTRPLIALYLNSEKEKANLLATIDSVTAPYLPLLRAESEATESLSLRDWLQSRSILVLGNDNECSGPINALNGVIVTCLATLILGQANNTDRHTWLFLDECPLLGRIEKMEELATNGRTKSCRIVLGFQTIDSMVATYGENGTGIIVDQCGNRIAGKVNNAQTAEWVAAMFGSREEQVTNQRQRVTNISPSDLMNFPPTGPTYGLHAACYLPLLQAAYKLVLPPEHLYDGTKLPEPDPNTPAYDRRDVALQFARPTSDSSNPKTARADAPAEKNIRSPRPNKP